MNRTVGRREVLAASAAGLLFGLAGCSDGEPAEAADDATESNGEDTADELSDILSTLDEVYDRLNTVPLVDAGTLAFDVVAFEDEFDHHEVMALAEGTLEDLDALEDDPEVHDETVAELSVVARVGDHLARQRFFLHQALTAGATHVERINEGEFEAATEAIRVARESLDGLSESGQTIDDELSAARSSVDGVDGFDPREIESTQDVLREVTTWLAPVFEGFHHTTRGLARAGGFNDDLDHGEFEAAKQRYETVTQHFEDADDAFERAHGRGERVPHFIPQTEEYRCSIPHWIDGYRSIADGFEALEDGDEETGYELLDEGLDELREPTQRCG